MTTTKIILWCFVAIGVGILLYDFVRMSILLKKSRELIATSKKYERVLPDATTSILFIGDSTAVETGSDNPNESVAGRFGTMFPEASIYNQGVNGQKINELTKNFISQKNPPFDLLVIQIGGNDILQFTNTSDVQKDLSTLLAYTSSFNMPVAVIHSGNVGLAPFFPRYLGWIWSLKTKQIRDVYIQETQKYNAAYIDLFQERKDDYSLKNIDLYYARDFVHPSGESYKMWFEKIREGLSQKYGPSFLK